MRDESVAPRSQTPPSMAAARVVQASPEEKQRCPTCQQVVLIRDLIPAGGHTVCANCRDEFILRLCHGLPLRPQERHPASLVKRGVAYLLDGMLLIFLWFIALDRDLVALREAFAGQPSLDFLLLVLLYVFYGAFFLALPQLAATPGMRLLGLRAVALDYGRLSPATAMGRSLASLISVLSLLLIIPCAAFGYVMALFNDERQTLHDRLLGVRVVERPLR